MKVYCPNGQVKIAMIGAGNISSLVHYPSLASFDDVKIEAVCDIDPERLKTAGDKYEIEKRYGKNVFDYRRMIEEVAPDAVYAIGPPQLFYDIWVWCLEHGVNLFVEKPMGMTVHQARILAYLAEKNHCITQVDFQRRCCPMAVKLREECLKRGTITHTLCRWYKGYGVGVPNKTADGHFMSDGIHAVDTVRWMCGGEVVKFDCTARNILTPDINFVSAIIQFDNGSVGNLICNWSSARRIFAIEMHAPNICAEAELETKGYLFENNDTKGIEFTSGEVAGSHEFYILAGYQAKSRNFIDCLKSGKQPESNFSDALKTVELTDRILARILLDS